MQVQRLAPSELDRIAPLRLALWPGSSADELRTLAETKPAYLVLMASEGEQPTGFAEVSLRGDHVNGCDSSPVAFLEGIYVDPAHRRKGVARALVAAALGWAGEHGLSELASDALLENESSHAFHRALGFAETERVVYYRRAVGARA